MAAQQTNKKRSNGRKSSTARRKSSKTKSAGRNYFAITGLIALLIILISASIYSIRNDKDDKVVEKKHTVIPVQQSKNTDNQYNIKPPEKKKDKTENKNNNEKPDYIADLIRLVLYDHEISKSAVKEKNYKNKSGKQVFSFDIVCSSEMKNGIFSSVSSILKKYGYNVSVDSSRIYGKSKKNDFVINLKEPKVIVKDDKTKTDNEIITKKDDGKKDKVEEAAEKKYPAVPAYSKKQVKFAILLDDGGNNLELAQEYVKLKYPVAVAVLPHLEHSQTTARIAKKAGKTVFLHFPMAPKSYPNTDPGKGAVIPSMPEILIDGVVKENFNSLGVAVDGFNNHMGSAITEDRHKMRQILDASKEYTNVFIDSRTTPDSAAYSECIKAGFSCGENKLFLDNEDDVYAIIEKIYEAAEKAKKKGSLIVIGHVRANTLEALKVALPQLEKNNYKVVPLLSLVKKG